MVRCSVEDVERSVQGRVPITYMTLHPYSCDIIKELSHGGALGLDTAGPVGISHHWLTVDQTLDVMLDHGELDAIFPFRPGSSVTAGNTTVIDRYGGTPLEGNSPILLRPRMD